jgi:CHAD domain-containing protein
MTMVRFSKWIEGVSPGNSTCAVAVRSLEARLAAVRHYLPLAAEQAEEDPEYVHELRVWTRRASAALDLYAGLLPRRRRTWLKKQLKRLRRAAGKARDCDVLAQRLAERQPGPETEAVLEKVRAQRRAAQRPIVAMHERLTRGDRFDRRVEKLLRCVRVRHQSSAAAPDPRFGEWARASLRPLVRRFFKAAPSAEAGVGALHQSRIRGKELRYAMELLAGAFPPDLREKLYPVVEALQDQLGEINDLATAQARLREDKGAVGGRAGPAALGKLLAGEKGRLRQALQDFRSYWTPRFRKELRAGFKALLARPAQAGLSPAPAPQRLPPTVRGQPGRFPERQRPRTPALAVPEREIPDASRPRCACRPGTHP